MPFLSLISSPNVAEQHFQALSEGFMRSSLYGVTKLSIPPSLQFSVKGKAAQGILEHKSLSLRVSLERIHEHWSVE
jgi:hypothetical protein